MGTVYKNFEQELATWARKYANSPADELIALCLLALEREELVAIGYRENLIRRRLTTMRVNDDVRELIEHSRTRRESGNRVTIWNKSASK